MNIIYYGFFVVGCTLPIVAGYIHLNTSDNKACSGEYDRHLPIPSHLNSLSLSKYGGTNMYYFGSSLGRTFACVYPIAFQAATIAQSFNLIESERNEIDIT